MSTHYTACGTPFVVDDADDDLVRSHKWHLCADEHRRYVHRAKRLCERKPGERGGSVSLHRHLVRPPHGFIVDHINGDGTDNRRANLRLCTTADNAANARLGARNTTGVKGLSLTSIGGRTYWVAEVMRHGVQHRTTRARREDAEAWLRQKREELHGEFARHA